MEIRKIIDNPDNIDMLRWINVVDNENNEKSDRALVIVSGSILDVQLEILLKTFLIDDSNIEERLFNSNSALATFSSKINLCYYLGIISKHEFDTINLIRKIRNIFAHEIEIVKIEDSPKLVSLCANLSIPKGMYVPDIIYVEGNKMKPFDTDPFINATPKDRFVKTFKYIIQYLNARYIDVIKRKCKPYIAKPQAEVLLEVHETMHKMNQKCIKKLEEYRDLVKNNIENLDEDYIDELTKIEEEIEARKSNVLYGTELYTNLTPKDFEEHIDIVKKGIDESYK